jgi:hypothetical protein
MLWRVVGLCLVGAVVLLNGAVDVALGHYPSSPAINQPVAGPGQGAGAADRQGNAAQKKPETGRIEPALKAIEAAIRELIAEENTIERERQEKRDIADLQAQQDMALWAERMTRATWTGVILTLVGIALIARTLSYTKKAAFAAEEAVRDARNATAAALKAVDVTQDLGIRQIRAYVNLSEAIITNFVVGQIPVVAVQVKNAGQTPAIALRMSTRMIIGPDIDIMRFTFKDLSEQEKSVTTINANLPVNRDLQFRDIVTAEDIEMIVDGRLLVVLGIYVRYLDVFQKRRRTIIKLILEADDSLRAGKGVFRPYHKGNRST